MKIISKVKYPTGKREILLFGKKVLSYKKKKKHTKYDEIYARRFDGLTEEEIRYCLEVQFERTAGYKLNLDNPQTFNEKIQWLKLYYRNPLMTKCADKVGVREYIKEKIGEEYLVPIIGIYNSVDEIDFDALPNKFVMKVNWGSGQNIIVKDKSALDINEAKLKLATWMKRESNHYFSFFEWGYKDIEPKIIVEEFLDFDDNLIDYKIMCYNGEPRNLFTCSERNSNLKVTFFDLNWNRLPFIRKYPSSLIDIKKPIFYDEMLRIAKILAEPFPFVRIDFYCIKNKLYIGEMTFYPGAGYEKFEPAEWDSTFGNLLFLQKKQTFKCPTTMKMLNLKRKAFENPSQYLNEYEKFLDKYGSWIGANAFFASPPIFPHKFYGIFISNGAKIGENCTIFQQVTIGSNNLVDSPRRGCPIIGDNVYIGCGAKIIGNVTIGNNVRIGANAVVVNDVPDNTVVVSQECKYISKTNMCNDFIALGENNKN